MRKSMPDDNDRGGGENGLSRRAYPCGERAAVSAAAMPTFQQEAGEPGLPRTAARRPQTLPPEIDRIRGSTA